MHITDHRDVEWQFEARVTRASSIFSDIFIASGCIAFNRARNDTDDSALMIVVMTLRISVIGLRGEMRVNRKIICSICQIYNLIILAR